MALSARSRAARLDSDFCVPLFPLMLLPRVARYRTAASMPADIFVDKSPRLDFSGWLIGNEIFTEGREALQAVHGVPKEIPCEERRSCSRTHQVVTVEACYIDESVRAVVHGVEKGAPSLVRHSCRRSDIHNAIQWRSK